jgi:hypothetical protein
VARHDDKIILRGSAFSVREAPMAQPSADLTEANRKIIRQAFEAWQQGTGSIREVFAPGMVWRIEGHSAVYREYGDRQQLLDEVQPRVDRFNPGDGSLGQLPGAHLAAAH